MMARGFKPVGWVAAVAGAALCCYMLSLNVAAERAELTKIERQIVAAKQDIRTLQTELGTRGRMAQLEQWNAEVLALSAPKAAQFLESEIVLARFETRQPSFDERAKVRMAAAELPSPAPAPALAPADYATAAVVATREPKPLVHRAAFVAPLAQPALQKATAALKTELKPSLKSVLEPKRPAPKAALATAGEVKAAKVKTAEAKTAAPARAEAKPTQFAEARKPVIVKKAAPAKKAGPASSTGMLDDSLVRELSEVSRSERTEDVPATR
jgi:hypothetical protein